MKKQKKIKAWAIIEKRTKKVVAIELRTSKPKRFYVGSWLSYVDCNYPVVPCEIKLLK